MDLLTTAQKVYLGDQLNAIHDTFARPLVIIRQAQQISVSENPTHNFIFDSGPDNTNNTTTTNTPVTGVFNGRILYDKKQVLNFFGSARGNKEDAVVVKLTDGEVRIKLDPTGQAFIAGATRVSFDGTVFEIDTSPRPHGLFITQFYTYRLKRLN